MISYRTLMKNYFDLKRIKYQINKYLQEAHIEDGIPFHSILFKKELIEIERKIKYIREDAIAKHFDSR